VHAFNRWKANPPVPPATSADGPTAPAFFHGMVEKMSLSKFAAVGVANEEIVIDCSVSQRNVTTEQRLIKLPVNGLSELQTSAQDLKCKV